MGVLSMRRLVPVLGALALLLVPASPAMAAPWLSKGRAYAKTGSVARALYLDLDWATRYSAEPASSCARLSRSVVECEYFLYDDEIDTICDDAVRIRLTATGTLRIHFPYSTD